MNFSAILSQVNPTHREKEVYKSICHCSGYLHYNKMDSRQKGGNGGQGDKNTTKMDVNKIFEFNKREKKMTIRLVKENLDQVEQLAVEKMSDHSIKSLALEVITPDKAERQRSGLIINKILEKVRSELESLSIQMDPLFSLEIRWAPFPKLLNLSLNGAVNLLFDDQLIFPPELLASLSLQELFPNLHRVEVDMSILTRDQGNGTFILEVPQWNDYFPMGQELSTVKEFHLKFPPASVSATRPCEHRANVIFPAENSSVLTNLPKIAASFPQLTRLEFYKMYKGDEQFLSKIWENFKGLTSLKLGYLEENDFPYPCLDAAFTGIPPAKCEELYGVCLGKLDGMSAAELKRLRTSSWLGDLKNLKKLELDFTGAPRPPSAKLCVTQVSHFCAFRRIKNLDVQMKRVVKDPKDLEFFLNANNDK